MSTKPTPGHRAPGPRARSASRWARLVALPAVLAAALLPTAASADTSGKLPQGYTNDSLPQLPANSDAPAAQPASDVTGEADAYADTDPSALDDFREPLTPYGAWVQDPTYGTVWVPSSVVVGADFAPYQTSGHWETTVDGDWLWVSDYSWGYIPFHYGRWVWIGGTGWAWIPGRLYAPAWVAWRVGDAGYIGWAPLPPAYYWSGGVAVTLWVVPPAAYVFCPTTYVFHHHVHTYVVHDHTKVKQIARGTRPYKPASPNGPGGGGGSKYKPAHPSPGGKEAAASAGRGRSGPPSPSFEEAKIPQGARPAARAAGDATALRYARPSTTPRSVGARASRGSFTAAPGATRSGRDIPAVGRAPATAPPQIGGPSGGGRAFSPAPAAPPPSAASKPARKAPSSSSSASNDNDSTRTPSSSPSTSFGGSSRSAPGAAQPAPAAKPAARPSARPSGPARGGRGRR